MTRLEKYKNILIPVDDVSYVEYRKPKKNAWSTDEDDNAGTYVHVRDGYMYGSIRIGKKNLLDDFKKWYDDTMARIGQGVAVEWGDSISYPQQIAQTTSEPDGGVDVLLPTHCHTTTTSNGETVVTIFGGHSSAAPSYVKRDGTSRLTMVQHDGIEHPL